MPQVTTNQYKHRKSLPSTANNYKYRTFVRSDKLVNGAYGRCR